MMQPITSEMVQAGLELVIRRSEAQVQYLHLTGASGDLLLEAEEELKSAVENLAAFFVLTGESAWAPVTAGRHESFGFTLN